MTQKKANELFSQYMEAETAGNDYYSIELEKELNDGGWYITSGPDGLTVARKDSTTDYSNVIDKLAPTQNNVQPTPATDNPNKTLWITIGSVVGAALLITLVIYIIKQASRAKAN